MTEEHKKMRLAQLRHELKAFEAEAIRAESSAAKPDDGEPDRDGLQADRELLLAISRSAAHPQRDLKESSA